MIDCRQPPEPVECCDSLVLVLVVRSHPIRTKARGREKATTPDLPQQWVGHSNCEAGSQSPPALVPFFGTSA